LQPGCAQQSESKEFDSNNKMMTIAFLSTFFLSLEFEDASGLFGVRFSTPLHFLHLSTLLTKSGRCKPWTIADCFIFPPTDGRRRVATSAKGTSNYRKQENNRNQTRAQR
jgi:hypothetical protein